MTGIDVSVVLPRAPIASLDEYLDVGGGEGIRAARALGTDATIEEISASGLRGRGGAGFLTGRKWATVAASEGTHFVVANGAEGEPATFKDRMLMRHDPYRIVEGAAIAAFAVGASDIFLATKAKYSEEADRLERAAAELTARGIVLETVTIVRGPDEYLFGEEKALLEVIEGRDPMPRVLPPYEHGLFATAPSGGWESESVRLSDLATSNPTVVNNVESLAAAVHIMANGADWYRRMGTPTSPGTIIVTIVGDVVRPGIHEVELGTPLSDVLDLCGGPLPGCRFRAAFSGVSNPVLSADDFDVPLSYEGLATRGSGLGAAGFAVYDDSVDMVKVAREFSRFLAVESCGQCPPCKDGSMVITEQLRIIDEHDDGIEEALNIIAARLRNVTDGNRCYLGQEEQNVVSSILAKFPEDFALRLEGRVPSTRDIVIPLIEDITADGEVRYDERHRRKRYDWTYEPDRSA